MRYLQVFNRRLRELRELRQLSRGELAAACGVDERTVASWEARDSGVRSYPTVAEIIDLCQRLDVSLEGLLDPDALTDPGQLELPGLAFSNSDELTGAVDELERVINELQQAPQLDDQESELVRRFRKSSAENQRMILQLLGG